jgi:hypothetical protein
MSVFSVLKEWLNVGVERVPELQSRTNATRSVILSEASRSFIARGAVEGSLYFAQRAQNANAFNHAKNNTNLSFRPERSEG